MKNHWLSAVAQKIFLIHFWRLLNLVKEVKCNSDIRSQGREKYDKTLAILLLHVFPFFHSLTFHWYPSVSLFISQNMFSAWYFELLKYFANRDYCFKDFWIRVLRTFLPSDACYFSYSDVDGETIVLKLIYHRLFTFFS